jgi:hypothetical protein
MPKHSELTPEDLQAKQNSLEFECSHGGEKKSSRLRVKAVGRLAVVMAAIVCGAFAVAISVGVRPLAETIWAIAGPLKQMAAQTMPTSRSSLMTTQQSGSKSPSEVLPTPNIEDLSQMVEQTPPASRRSSKTIYKSGGMLLSEVVPIQPWQTRLEVTPDQWHTRIEKAAHNKSRSKISRT